MTAAEQRGDPATTTIGEALPKADKEEEGPRVSPAPHLQSVGRVSLGECSPPGSRLTGKPGIHTCKKQPL